MELVLPAKVQIHPSPGDNVAIVTTVHSSYSMVNQST